MCRYNGEKIILKPKDWMSIASNSAQALKIAIARAPVSVAVEADSEMFRFYRSGFINSQLCGTETNHAVLVVGYGVEPVTKEGYYIVKNSWSADWGENGYVKIGIENGPGICGIHKYPSQPIF